jgi:DUF4097 and DUF4098 domain-containing protein YvlB
MRRTETFTSWTGATTGNHTMLTIELPSGSVEVRSVESSALTVHLDTDQPDEWEVSQFGDSVSVRAPRRRGLRSRSAKVYVEAPTGTHVDINAASADIALSGTLGEVRVRSASGDVRAGTLDRLDASTASGDIRVGIVHGRLTASTASGDIRADRVGDDIDAGTASGDVRVDCCDGSSIDAKTVSGDIQLGLPAGIRVEPDIGTMTGRTNLPKAAGSSPAVEPRRTVRVRLRSVSGDITIERVNSR